MTFFQTLSTRDKKTLAVGVIVAIILIMTLAWQMLASRLTAAEQTAQKTRELLEWIKQADTRLRGQSLEQTAVASKEPLPAIVQSALAGAGMASHMKRLRQNEKGAVDLSLTSVNFDRLLTVLAHIQKISGAIPIQIHVTRTTETGGVNTDMLLQK